MDDMHTIDLTQYVLAVIAIPENIDSFREDGKLHTHVVFVPYESFLRYSYAQEVILCYAYISFD